MFSNFQIIILVIETLALLVLGPYLIIRHNKKLNQNQSSKTSPKRKLISYLILSVMIISFQVFTMYTDNITEVKKESKPIPEPQIETKAEYYYKKNEYGHDITSIKYALTEEDKPFCNSQGKWMLNNVSGEISEPIIERKYTFFGFNGLDNCQYKDKVPKDLAPFIREPFNNWYYIGKMKPYKDHGGSVSCSVFSYNFLF
ncbi:hypothetical protein RS022_01160 [Candidatus Phytoplasma rubi]|uniref:Uncharacterized protein n=1 Tax=Candidatus Phytoplasma rubi TaxID=399025 RepID=A0ABY7BQS9_9MOLU|nr:hypothetical protein [Candidatus Phytoplasma rubi]WAN63114.1 hypothetical protein RS022_01160 [Candidatus Phytoplasma rubi]